MIVFGSFLFVSLVVCACAGLATHPQKEIFDLDDEAQLVQFFNDFKQEYKKNYQPSEHPKRYKLFVDNLAEINAMNERDPTASYGINIFTDMTTEEFAAAHTGYVRDPSVFLTTIVKTTEIPDIEIPKQFDWRDHNIVTSVKYQGICGCGWAFSAVGNIEGQYAIKHKELVDFSSQQLVDCDTHRFDYGCLGGDGSGAMDYLLEVGGLETDQDYPYISGDGGERFRCKFNKKNIKVTIESYKQYDFSNMTEDQVAQLLVTTGPLSIGLAAKNLKTYTGGILSEEHCKNSKIDHAVLLVGYGEENGVPYWLFKNSWGKASGEEGYFRMQRGVNCLNFMNDFGVSAVLK